MLKVVLKDIILSGRSLNKFSYIPSILLAGAIVDALSEEGITMEYQNIRVSRFIDGDEKEQLIPFSTISQFITSKKTLNRKFEDFLDENRKHIKSLRVPLSKLQEAIDLFISEDEDKIKELLDKEEEEKREERFEVLAKKTRMESRLYNTLIQKMKRAVIFIDGISKEQAKKAFSYLEDIGLSADKTTLSSIKLESIEEVSFKSGSWRLNLSDVILGNSDNEIYGRLNVYSSFPTKEGQLHFHSFYFVEAFSLSRQEIGENRFCEECNKLFLGKPISIGVDIDV